MCCKNLTSFYATTKKHSLNMVLGQNIEYRTSCQMQMDSNLDSRLELQIIIIHLKVTQLIPRQCCHYVWNVSLLLHFLRLPQASIIRQCTVENRCDPGTEYHQSVMWKGPCSSLHIKEAGRSGAQCSAVQGSALQCSAVQCSAVQCSAVQSGQSIAAQVKYGIIYGIVQSCAVYCSAV